MKKQYILISLVAIMAACNSGTVKIKNKQKGRLKASVSLVESGEKRFVLDNESAPQPQYTEMFKDTNGVLYFTFLNRNNNSIYFYDYNTLEFVKKYTYDRQGPNSVPMLMGYHIVSMDSIYLFNYRANELVHTNGKCQVLERISLRGENNGNLRDVSWLYIYPQYLPQTVTPLIGTQNKIIQTGFFSSYIPDSIIDSYKITSMVDMKNHQVTFRNTYPKDLYGNNVNWPDVIWTQAYCELHPDGDKLIYSFPVSHDLYISGLNSDGYKKVYAGSNLAGTIQSLDGDSRQTPPEKILFHGNHQHVYAAIKYDRYRKVYYRFLLKPVPNATSETKFNEKPVAVIIMDENFNYLGETTIGTQADWKWQNSFVTEEGLNIEHIDTEFNIVSITLRIYTPEKI